MAYVPDSDGLTRGVGAIAATDGPRARQRRRQVAQATRTRDRTMAAVARGALGLVKLPRDMANEAGSTYAPVEAPPAMWIPSPTIGTTIMTGPPVTTTAAPYTPPFVQPSTPVTSTIRPGGGGSPVPGTPSGIVMGLPPPAPVLYTPPDVPLPESPVPTPDNSTRNMLLLGGAAVAAYLLFFRKRSP